MKKNIKMLGIVVAIFLLLSAYMCERKDNIEKTAILKEQVRVAEQKTLEMEEDRISERDSLNKEIEKSRKEIEKTNKKVSQSKKRVAEIEKKFTKRKQQIKNLDKQEVAKELNKIYETNQAVATDVSVNLNGDLGNRVLETVEEANTCQDIVAEKNSQLKDKDTVIKESAEIITKTEAKLYSAEKTIKQQKEENDLKTKLNTDLEKQLEKKKNKGWIVPTAVVLGIILGTQL